MSILQLENIGYTYDRRVAVLNDLNWGFEKGRIYGITGRSGAGKSTLLSLLSGLASPTSGRILYDGQDIAHINKYDYRSRYLGVVFQGFNLLPHLTAVENVVLSLDICGKKIKDKRQYAYNLLEKVNLDQPTCDRRILKLSGGEQQRVAIARALSFDPDIVLADEPTGNLDVNTQGDVMEIFKKLAHEEDKCIIIVTHSPEVARNVDEILPLAPLSGKR